MCSILGFVGRGRSSRPDLDLIAKMAIANIHRGRDAWGVVAREGAALRPYRQPGSILANFATLEERLENANAAAIHMRFATRGKPGRNRNNHPHPFQRPGGRGYLIHNGTVTHAKRLARIHRLSLSSDCDSEVLAAYLGTLRQRSRLQRVAEVATAAQAWSDDGRHQQHALMAMWPDLLVIARAGKPLSWLQRPEGLYFASLPPADCSGWLEFPPAAAIAWNLRKTKRPHRTTEFSKTGQRWLQGMA